MIQKYASNVKEINNREFEEKDGKNDSPGTKRKKIEFYLDII